MTDVVIVGGGIMGLLTARELVAQGVRVSLVERSEIGTEASWAGGGIISPLYPWTYDDAVTQLASWAQQAYPLLAQSLQQETGIDPELNRCGLLVLDSTTQNSALAWARSHQVAIELLDNDGLAAHEPALDKFFEQALWLPHIGNIRNPRLLQALRSSLEAHPDCELITGAEVTAINSTMDAVEVINTSSNTPVKAGKAVVCAGAWTRDLLAPLSIDVPIQPVRGQMLLFKPVPGLVNRIVLFRGKYLIPRCDGRVLVGSTLEYEGFTKQTTKQARLELLASAYEMVPALRDAEVEAHWCGLRPGTPAGIPFIGSVPGNPNIIVNAGHYRNGLVLAPASARLTRDLVLGKTPEIDPFPYRLDR